MCNDDCIIILKDAAECLPMHRTQQNFDYVMGILTSVLGFGDH